MPRACIQISKEIHDKFKSYSQLTGVPIVTAAEEALEDWFETTGRTRMEMLVAKASGRIVSFPESGVPVIQQVASTPT